MLADLIQRLEQAEGPSSELDAEIYNILDIDGWVAFEITDMTDDRLEGRLGDCWRVGESPDDKYAEKLPAYTKSIDASDTIPMPEGWEIGSIDFSDAGVSAWLEKDGSSQRPPYSVGHHYSSEAMARTIARLKARDAAG